MNGSAYDPRRVLGGLFRAYFNLLLPPSCVYCQADLDDLSSNIYLCKKCLAKLGPNRWLGCRRCGATVAEDSLTSEHCPNCDNRKLHFDSVIVLGSYHVGLAEAVKRMKRTAHDPLSLAMGRLFCERRGGLLREFEADVVVPVPMFWRRRIATGKNSPEVLARCAASAIGVPYRRRLLTKIRDTPQQKGLSVESRVENVRGAFRVRRPALADGARVLLIDDVMATGATGSEAAKTLKKAGAAAVAAAVVARAGY